MSLPNPQLRQYFGKIRSDGNRKKMCEARIPILLYLIMAANRRLRAWYGVKAIMEDTGYSKSIVSSTLRYLQSCGAIYNVPPEHRVGAEKKVHGNRKVWQLTGVIALGKEVVDYLYIKDDDRKSAYQEISEHAPDDVKALYAKLGVIEIGSQNKPIKDDVQNDIGSQNELKSNKIGSQNGLEIGSQNGTAKEVNTEKNIQLRENTLKDSSPSVEDAPRKSHDEINTTQDTVLEESNVTELPDTDISEVEDKSLEPDTPMVQEKEKTDTVDQLQEVSTKRDIADVALDHIEQVTEINKCRDPNWQLVVSKAMNFDLETGKEYGLTGQFINFFTGQCNYQGKSSVFNAYQCNGKLREDGLKNVSAFDLSQIIGLTLYYRAWREPNDKAKQAKLFLPRGPKTLQEKCQYFLASPDYEKYMATAKLKLEALLDGSDADLDNQRSTRFDNLSTPKPEDYAIPEGIEYA